LKLTPTDLERLRSWPVEIASTLLPEGNSHHVEGRETVFTKSGGLHIHDDGRWYIFALRCGHWNTVPLIERLKGCSRDEAEQWAAAWLVNHPGEGRCNRQSNDADDGSGLEFADYAQELLDKAADVEGTVAEIYLRSRGLEPPYPACVRFVPDVRAGEHGILGLLTARGRVVGVQLGYLTPGGSKSLVLPNRRSFRLEKDGYLEGVFAVQVPSEASSLLKTRPDLVTTEGLENALSIAAASTAPWIVGIPGIGRLPHLQVGRDSRIVIFRDGDAKDSPADKALTVGADALLLAGADVRITATPADEDANSILQKQGSGEVARLLREASAADSPRARLSRDGAIARLARLDPLDFEMERLPAAKELGLRAEVLEAEVRKKRRPEPGPESAGASSTSKDAPWDDVINLRAALDATLTELRRYIVAKETTLATVAIWAVHAHLLANQMVQLQRSPRLKIESRTPGCGKTTTLEITVTLSPRGRILSGYSASSVMRTIARRQPTLGLDEGDRGVVGNNDLMQIIDAGDRRSTALITRSIKLPDGNWGEEELDVFGAMAIAAIDELPGTAEERCIRVHLLRARADEVKEELQNGTSPELVNIRRHFAAWAAAQTELPEPTIPEELKRQAPRVVSNWRTLLVIAEAAGGRWPDLIRQAALEEISAEREPNQLEQLLKGIRAAFDAQRDVMPGDRRAADDRDRIRTTTLLSYLLQDAGEEWNRANRGRAINAYFLREKLRNLLSPAGTRDWETGSRSDRRQHHRGYERYQFTDVWSRYLGTPVSPPVATAASGGSGGSGGSAEKMAAFRHTTPPDPPDGAETPPDPMGSPGKPHQEKSASETGSCADPPDPPDPPDAAASSREGRDRRKKGEPAQEAGPEPAPQTAPDIELIRAAKVENPTWGRARIATELGVPEHRVRAALAGWEPPVTEPVPKPPGAPPGKDVA
jgi:hypothetical protein